MKKMSAYVVCSAALSRLVKYCLAVRAKQIFQKLCFAQLFKNNSYH